MADASKADPTARIIAEVLAQLGADAEPVGIRERVERLQAGLPAEDEFSVLISWLGKCNLVHKLDQLQSPPSSASIFKIPDLIAIFQRPSSELSVLIEVKTSNDNKLSWRPDYYKALQNYSSHIGLPVLVAWKLKSINFWTLVDLAIFEKAEKNYNLSMQAAFQNNLLGELAGDFHYDFQPGVGLHLHMEKLKENPPAEDGSREVLVQIREAYFTDSRNNHLKTLGPGIFWLFLGLDHEASTEIKSTEIIHSYQVTGNTPSQAVHRILPIVVAGISATSAVPWRKILEEGNFTLLGTDVLKEAVASIDRGIVHHILNQVPKAAPKFIAK